MVVILERVWITGVACYHWQTVDPRYADEQAKVIALEAGVRNLQNNISTWMEEGDVRYQ